jgi:8-oxo-dGTP diphosphatase
LDSVSENCEQAASVIEAAGGLLWRTSEGLPTLAVLHRPRYDDWTLPKGKREQDESWSEAAFREVAEETDCQVALGRFAGCTCYTVGRSPKIVLFWHMTVSKEGTFRSDNETDRLVWLAVDDALAKLDYDNERELLRKSLPPAV